MKSVILITGASSGFGALEAQALARAGRTVYPSMPDTTGRNAPRITEAKQYAAEHGVDLRTVELDVGSQASADAAVNTMRRSRHVLNPQGPSQRRSAGLCRVAKVIGAQTQTLKEISS